MWLSFAKQQEHLFVVEIRKSVLGMSDPNKRRKGYYVQAGKAKKPRAVFQLDAGMKGFLITCNNAEKRAVQEAYSLFNEYADKIYGAEQMVQDEKSNQREDDFESAIREEVEAMKKRDAETRRFQVVESKTNNCVFIKTTLEHPDELVTKIFTELCESQKSKSRFILKLYPVIGTCRAAEDKIEKLAEEVLPPFLTDAIGSTYCVIYKVRCNNSLGRDAIIQLVARVAAHINPTLKVKFDDPDLVISVDILQKICCISVLKNFNKFKKYNVQEVVSPSGIPQVLVPSAGTSDATGNRDAERSERNDSELTEVAKSKDSTEEQDFPDVKISEPKTELPSELKSSVSFSDANNECLSPE